MLIEDMLAELGPVSHAYKYVTLQIEDIFSETFGVLRDNGYQEEINTIKGFLTANIALNDYFKNLINEYQNEVNTNYAQMLKNEI